MQQAPPIEAFPKDVQDFVHDLISRAIQRSIKNGTYQKGGPYENVHPTHPVLHPEGEAARQAVSS